MAQAGGTQLRVELARLNGARPLQDGLLGPDSFDSALEAIHDLCTIEADLKAKGAAWQRPPPPPTFGQVKGLIGALGRAVHAARDLAPARAPVVDAARADSLTVQPGSPLPPPDSSPFAAGGLPVYGASSKLAHSATSTIAIDAAVAAPLLTRAALAAEFAATPHADIIPEARRLCTSFGNAAVAYHLSSGTADAPTAGEHVPLSLHTSRAATWKRTLHLVSTVAVTPDLESSRPVANAIASLTGIKCAAFTPLLGGHSVTKVRGESLPKAGTAGACVHGTLTGDGARFSLLQAVGAVATVICATIGVYADLLGAGDVGTQRLCGIPMLAEALVVGAGVPGAVVGLDDFFEQLAGEVALLRSDADAANLDIAGLVAAFTTHSLPGHLENRRFDDKFAARQPAAPSAAAISTAATAAAAAKAKLALDAALAAGQPPPAPPSAPPPGPIAPGQRQADPSSKRSLAKAAKLAGLPPPGKLPRLATAAGAQQATATAATAAAIAAQQQATLAAATLQRQQAVLAQQAAMQQAAAHPVPHPPPPPALAAALLANLPAPPAQPLPGAVDITAVVAEKPVTSFGSACQAVDRVVKASAGVGAQWPCALTFLFGVCSGASAAKPCRRCADPRPSAAIPAGTRTAVKLACTDPITAGKILAGG